GGEELVRLPRSSKYPAPHRCRWIYDWIRAGNAWFRELNGRSDFRRYQHATGSSPDWVRSKLHLFEAVHIGHDRNFGQYELQRHEHRNGAWRFHDRAIEYHSATSYYD